MTNMSKQQEFQDAMSRGYIAMAKQVEALDARIAKLSEGDDAMRANQQRREHRLAGQTAPQTGSVGGPMAPAPQLGSTPASDELEKLAQERAVADGCSYAKAYQQVIRSDVGLLLLGQHRAQNAGYDGVESADLAKVQRGETPAHEQLVKMAERMQRADPMMTYAKAYQLATRTSPGRRLLLEHYHQRGHMPA